MYEAYICMKDDETLYQKVMLISQGPQICNISLISWSLFLTNYLKNFTITAVYQACETRIGWLCQSLDIQSIYAINLLHSQ